MNAIASFINASHSSSLPFNLLPRPSDFFSRAEAYSDDPLSADASSVWRCLISSIHLPSSVWSAIATLIKNKNDIVVRNVFILIFTRSGRLFGRLVYNNKITIKGEI